MLMLQQEETYWCWAAVSVSVDRLFFQTSTGWSQCGLAERVLPGVSGCCGAPAPCNQPSSLEAALDKIGNLRTVRVGAASFARIRTEIAANRPVCCRIQWDGGGGHAVAIDGCMEFDSGEQLVHVVDPFYDWGVGGGSYMDYDDLRFNYRLHGTWTHTYLVKR